jgi:uroporphyrinogen-III synthase
MFHATIQPMQHKVVAILEARAGEHMAELVARRGGIPLLAPTLEEIPDVDPQAIAALVAAWRDKPYKVAIFQTGVGTRALFKATDDLSLTGELLELLRASTVVVRGPKPVGELNARGVVLSRRAAAPFTTADVLTCLADIDLAGERVLVQRYGAANRELRDALQSRHATVDEVVTYRWGLPADVEPLYELLDALRDGKVAAVVFTSAVQIQNFHAVAERAGRAGDLSRLLNGRIIASVGPVCSRALRSFGVEPTFEANPPKLGPLLAGLEAALAD